MIGIADYYFDGDELSVVNYGSDDWLELFEGRLGFDPDATTKRFFVIKIVPTLIFCGASVVSTVAEGDYLKYEVTVHDVDHFMNCMEGLIAEVSGNRQSFQG